MSEKKMRKLRQAVIKMVGDGVVDPSRANFVYQKFKKKAPKWVPNERPMKATLKKYWRRQALSATRKLEKQNESNTSSYDSSSTTDTSESSTEV